MKQVSTEHSLGIQCIHLHHHATRSSGAERRPLEPTKATQLNPRSSLRRSVELRKGARVCFKMLIYLENVPGGERDCMYVCVSVFLSVYVCVYIIYREKQRQAERDRER